MLRYLLFWRSLKWRQNHLALLEYADGIVAIQQEMWTYIKRSGLVGRCYSLLTPPCLFCLSSPPIYLHFLAYLYSRITCLLFFLSLSAENSATEQRGMATFSSQSCLLSIPFLSYIRTDSALTAWVRSSMRCMWSLGSRLCLFWMLGIKPRAAEHMLFPRLHLLLWTDEEIW